MRLTVLGGDGGIAAGRRTSALRVDDDILIDCGTGVCDLTISAMAEIEHIFITHAHMDHIACLPLLADSVIGKRSHPIAIYAMQEACDALMHHIFNGVIWPDFTAIPTPEAPTLRMIPIDLGDQIDIGFGRTVQPLPANHHGGALGFAVSEADRALAFSGDSGPCPEFWQSVQTISGLELLIVECSFPDGMSELALHTGHLTPKMVAEAIDNLDPALPVYVSHVKPAFFDQVQTDLHHWSATRVIHVLNAGETLTI